MECKNCEQDKPITEFKHGLEEPWGLFQWCEVCWKAKRTEAWTIYRQARRDGLISPTNMCTSCWIPGDDQKNKIEGHHLNYNYALFVVWLCPKCHREAHKKYRAEVLEATRNSTPVPAYYPTRAGGLNRDRS